MENAAAYAMLVLGGKEAPTAADVKAVIVAAGKAEPDEASIEALIKDLEGAGPCSGVLPRRAPGGG